MARGRGLAFLARAGMVALTVLVGVPATPAAAGAPSSTYIVVGSADPSVLESAGFHVTGGLREAGVLFVEAADPSGLASVPGVTEYALDAADVTVPVDETVETVDASNVRPDNVGAADCWAAPPCGTQWDLSRIHAPEAWKTTKGAGVKVAVLDTGLRATHTEVGPNYDVAESRSFVQDSPCPSDSPSNLDDLNGHGTWVATHIAGRSGSTMSGIAPAATLVNVKVVSNCGYALNSWLLAGMLYAGSIGAQVENVSLGGYICGEGYVAGSARCGNPDDPTLKSQQALYHAYQHVVDYLKAHGTVVVAGAGNEHVQLDRFGQVVSHGSVGTCKPAVDPCNDLYGTTEVPAGVPHFIAVTATDRVTGSGAASETRFPQYGAHEADQLAFYSSFGPRIDLSAPGGARNYNIPQFDCSRTSAQCPRLNPARRGSDGYYDNPGDFGAYNCSDSCYAVLQGTSMAAPQVAGVAVLAIASHPGIHSEQLIKLLQNSVTTWTDPNATPGVEDDPSQPTFGFDMDYDGAAIANSEMGAGITDAALAVNAR